MRRPLLVLVSLAALGVALLLFWALGAGPRRSPLPAASAPAAASRPAPDPGPSVPTAIPTVGPSLPRSPLADALGAAGTPPADEPRLVLSLLEAYRRQLGVYPTGEDNRALLRLLTGANSARLAFVPADHPRLDARGQLLDAWGSPFFFHLLARDRIEVRSAGPDRQLYTADDVLAASHAVPADLPSR